MFSYSENRKTTYFDVFCLNFSIETKIKTLFLISYSNLSKKSEITLWVHGLSKLSACKICPLLKVSLNQGIDCNLILVTTIKLKGCAEYLKI